MPNECSNTLLISGERKEVLRCFESIRGEKEEIDFDKIIPYPKEFAEADKNDEKSHSAGFWAGGKEWREDNWGVKWNAYETNSIIHENGFIEIVYLTPWSPSEPIIIKLSEMYPTLRFKLTFEEENMDFCGYREYINGNLIDSKDGSCEDEDEDEQIGDN